MSSLRYTFRCLRDVRLAAKPHWSSTAATTLTHRPKTCSSSTRSISTTASRPAIAHNEPISSEPPPGFNDIVPAPQFQGKLGSAGGSDSGSGGTTLISGNNEKVASVAYARVMPVSPSYFSRQPIFNDGFVIVQDLARKYARLPILPKEKVAPTAWRTKEQYRLAVGEHVKARDYATCMKLVKRLNQIHPDLVPEEVTAGLLPFKREVNFYLNKPKPVSIDRFGRAHAVGKRKSSVARAWVVEGTGEVLVNGKPLSDAFGRLHDRESAVWALKTTDRLDKYNVWALVHGGGTTGQAEATTLAVAKALCAHEPALKNPLRRAGCITRDPRKVERKKHGHVKARKMPTWTKR
ncbi:40S ribosomal protein S9 [Xylariales sp. AK1849]|nr:40S ribosomal protein S9 [Xylariales sp. AK1849]